MKILLLQPPLDVNDNAKDLKALDDDDNTLVSMGLYSIATVLLDNGFEVSLLNQTTTPWQQAISEVLRFQPDLVGITCLSHNRHAILQLADALKEKGPSIKIALGGIHASSLFNLILRKHPSVDYIAIGEAEYSFLELANRLASNQSTSGIKGIVQRKPGFDCKKTMEIVPMGEVCRSYVDFDWIGPADPIDDLGQLPIPAKYFKYSIVSTARGCPFNCTFCSSPQIFGRNVRNRPIEHVLEELSLLRNKHGIDLIYFKDETFTMSKKRVIELCKAMVEAKLHFRWTCDTRTDCLNEEALYWMRKAGCFYVSVGVESGSETMLAQIDKKTDLKKIKKGTAMARKFGLLIRYYIIANLPDEATQDRQASIDIIEECKPHYVTVSLLKLSPSTGLYRRYCAEKNKDDSIWFDDPRFWIPYNEECDWRDSPVGLKLLSYKYKTEKEPQFAYTEEELRDFQARMSDCFVANHDLALHLLMHNKFDEAIHYYQLALGIWPDFTKARIELGICLLSVNRAVEARDLFEELSKKISDNPIIWFRLGNAYLKLNACQQAEECFRKVLALQEDHVPACNQLGLSLERQGKTSEALEMFKKILLLVPNHPQAMANSARITGSWAANSVAARR